MTDSHWLYMLLRRYGVQRKLKNISMDSETGFISYSVYNGGSWQDKDLSPTEATRIAEDFRA